MRRAVASCCVGVAAMLFCGEAFAGVTLLKDSRYVEASAGVFDSEYPPIDFERTEGTPFAPLVDISAYAEYFDEQDGDAGIAKPTQKSTLQRDAESVRVNGTGRLDRPRDSDGAIALTGVNLVFELDAPGTFAFDTSYLFGGSSPGPGIPRGSINLIRLDDGDKLVDIDMKDVEGKGLSNEYTASGKLEAGRYSFDYELFSLVSPGDSTGEYDFGFSVLSPDGGSPKPVPLPPTAWAGLATLAGIGASRLIGRLRRV